MTVEIKRLSPLSFPGKILKAKNYGHWPVVQEYEAEGQGPWVFYLSHRTRWDLPPSPDALAAAGKLAGCRV